MNIVSRRTLTALILLGMLLCACAGREVLVSKSATAPPGLDLSGIWTLRASENVPPRPSVTSMMSWVCFQYSYCDLLM
jgi:hypothetical protein